MKSGEKIKKFFWFWLQKTWPKQIEEGNSNFGMQLAATIMLKNDLC